MREVALARSLDPDLATQSAAQDVIVDLVACQVELLTEKPCPCPRADLAWFAGGPRTYVRRASTMNVHALGTTRSDL